MHDALFQNQATLQPQDLKQRARELGLDLAIFSRCVDAGEARPMLERHKSAARALGVQSTPVFLVGIVQSDGSVAIRKRINGAVPYSDFHSTIKDVTPRELRNRIRDLALRDYSQVHIVRLSSVSGDSNMTDASRPLIELRERWF
jgi:predicted DsbA family dithiol-disulfide isomerase